MPFRSDRYRRYLTLALVGVVIVPLPRVLPSVAQATTVIIQEGTVQREDLYAFGSRVLVEGVVEGDLVVAARQVVVTGRVDGDVLGVAWDGVVVAGEVGGSVRVAARNVDVTPSGVVGDDLAAIAWSVDVAGSVRRDLLAAAGGAGIGGTVGRDVRGQVGSLAVRGSVERTVDVAVRSLRLHGSAVVGGDVSYRSHAEARVAGDANVAGQIFRREPRSQLWTRAMRRATGVLSLFAFLVAGLAAAWLLRRTWPAAARQAARRPVLSLAAGLAFLVLAPPAAVLLGVTIVGLPVALALAVAWLAALLLGPVPALAALGSRALGGKGGLLAGFVAAALVWRGAIWLLPVGGIVVYGVAAVWGTGSWLLGARTVRRSLPAPAEDPFALPAAPPPPAPEGWEPPLAPSGSSLEGAGHPLPDGDPPG